MFWRCCLREEGGWDSVDNSRGRMTVYVLAESDCTGTRHRGYWMWDRWNARWMDNQGRLDDDQRLPYINLL